MQISSQSPAYSRRVDQEIVKYVNTSLLVLKDSFATLYT
jgi:hypothetical protein